MAAHAIFVAEINRYGVMGYTSTYPIFYHSSWSAISKLLPFPYCNTLVLISFFNHIFTTLSFYLLAKSLFNHQPRSLFSTFALIIPSGFSWLYLLTEPIIQHPLAINPHKYYNENHE
ncbi:MAG: hypothetical protein NZ952_01165 [Candidatus Bathyarchaeota archaeon]|nr:hypothetical protein [Candidatus Bathyarchaeota archaeon]